MRKWFPDRVVAENRKKQLHGTAIGRLSAPYPARGSNRRFRLSGAIKPCKFNKVDRTPLPPTDVFAS
jgi:hypothetical protein